MRVINIIQCTNLGGMEQASVRLMTSLIQRGHSVSVISLNPLGGLAPLLAENGIPALGVRYRGFAGWRTALELAGLIHRMQPDALLMTGHHLLGSMALARATAKRKVLAIHFHHAGSKPKWQWRLIYECATRIFDAITFPSEFVRNEAIEICPAVERISRVVRNPLPLPPLPSKEDKAEARASLGLPPNAFLIGNAGWLIPRKRFDIFIAVAAEVALHNPAAFFVIAGDGPERSVLAFLARERGIVTKLRWLGWQKDLEKFYMAIDVLLFNSDYDAFPTTPLEAMSYGVPVVASALHGGLSEVMCRHDVGTLLARHDIAELARCVNELFRGRADSPSRLREAVASSCRPEVVAATMEQLLST